MTRMVGKTLGQEQLAKKILRLAVIGTTAEEVAGLLQVPAQQIKILYASPMFQAMLKVEKQRVREQLAEQIPDRLDALAGEAVDAYKRGLQDDDPAAYLRAADAILDRGKYPKRTQIDATHTITVHIDAEQKSAIESACEDASIEIPSSSVTPVQTEPASGLKHIDEVLAEPDEPK